MAAKKRDTAAEAPLPRTSFRKVLGRFVFHVVPMCCLLTVAGTGSYSVWRLGLVDERFVVPPHAVTLKQEGRNGYDFSRLDAYLAGRNLLDPRALSAFTKALEENPWIERVHACRRILPNQVRTEFSLREPFAQVWQNGQYWLISRDAVALPTTDRYTPDTGMPIIQCDAAAILRNGERSTDQGLRDALDIIDTLRLSPVGAMVDLEKVHVRRSGYTAPNLSKRRTQPMLELVTREGAIIKWGENRSRQMGDNALLNTEKLDLLRRALEYTPSLRKGNILDVRTRAVTCSETPSLP